MARGLVGNIVLREPVVTRRALVIGGMAVLVFCRVRLARAQDISSYYDIAMAAARNKANDVIVMLQAGKIPNVTDDSGETPIGYAAQFGNIRMLQALIYYKAKVDARDRLGNTPLHWAALRGNTAAIELLLGAKAMVDPQNRQGVTPLMMAASHSQVPAVRLLLKNGADPHKQDFTGRDAIGWADGKLNVLQFLRAAKPG